MSNAARLYYIHDPMCSWCWGFRRTWATVLERLGNTLPVEYVLGGLAPDTQNPMPQEMQTFLQNTWQHIQQAIPGTRFNFDFWTQCQPRRSTYPACRAVIATRRQQPALETAMILAIQEAYYLKARNPSDDVTLTELAHDLKLDTTQFSRDLASSDVQQALLSEIQFGRELGAQGFPSIVLEKNGINTLLQLDYNNPDRIIQQVT